VEEAAVIGAHREALRLSHRLVLILVPEDPVRAASLAAELEAREGWRVALRSADQEPDRETEVYIPDSAAEYGLWYRLAPVTFLGGSLLGEGCGRSPMEPASLGSAVIFGPRPGRFGVAYGRLGAARAARAVASAADLQAGLNDLLSPDRAAKLAQAAWTVASEGVEVTSRVLDLIRQHLDA
jgi:3-deoxy-D-manno-octulosonic-acid transferase